MIDTLFNIIAPHSCVACNTEGSLLCVSCQTQIERVPSRCFNCQALTKDFKICTTCQFNFSMQSVWVYGQYQGVIKQLIHQYKFMHKRAASQQLATMLTDLLPNIRPTTVIVSVPTATSHIRERGFDHTQKIATTFAYKRGLVYVPCLRRSGQAHQIGLKKNQRAKNIQNTMYASKKHIAGQNILLIDDVVTTGATLQEASRALLAAGANRVDTAVIAHVPL